MRYIIDPILGLFVGVFGLFVRWWFALSVAGYAFYRTQSPYCAAMLLPWLGFVLAWASIKWDSAPSPGGDGGVAGTTLRGDMRFGKAIYQTPDERMPGDPTQEAVGAWLSKYGKWVCAYLWAGERNVAMGLAHLLGHEAVDYMPEHGAWYAREDAWRLIIPLGMFRIAIGNQVVRELDGRFRAVPLFSPKRF